MILLVKKLKYGDFSVSKYNTKIVKVFIKGFTPLEIEKCHNSDPSKLTYLPSTILLDI